MRLACWPSHGVRRLRRKPDFDRHSKTYSKFLRCSSSVAAVTMMSSRKTYTRGRLWSSLVRWKMAAAEEITVGRRWWWKNQMKVWGVVRLAEASRRLAPFSCKPTSNAGKSDGSLGRGLRKDPRSAELGTARLAQLVSSSPWSRHTNRMLSSRLITVEFAYQSDLSGGLSPPQPSPWVLKEVLWAWKCYGAKTTFRFWFSQGYKPLLSFFIFYCLLQHSFFYV